MPLYDFKCRKCGGIFEAFGKVANHVKDCELCGEAFADRLLTFGGIAAFGSQTFEDLHEDDNLKEITSKEQLAKECHKAGVYATQLMGSDKYERIMRGEY